MKKGEFISVSKNMVRQYLSRYVIKTGDVQKIKMSDIEVIGFHEDEDSYRILLTATASNDLYFGATYYKNTNKFNSYTYKKVGKKINGKKNRINRYYSDFK